MHRKKRGILFASGDWVCRFLYGRGLERFLARVSQLSSRASPLARIIDVVLSTQPSPGEGDLQEARRPVRSRIRFHSFKKNDGNHGWYEIHETTSGEKSMIIHYIFIYTLRITTPPNRSHEFSQYSPIRIFKRFPDSVYFLRREPRKF